MPAFFTIDPRSGVPIYLQIIEQVKRSVALGVLDVGEQLPTVKQLAKELTVNPNTVARAYRDLEHDGVIETSPGRGSFVRANGAPGAARRAVAEVAASAVEGAVREAKSLGLTRRELRELVDHALDRWYPEHDVLKEGESNR
ncbi:MAG TPA: GntR family transcriptional regulator [Candidatus Dormibacteraeota bacterium]|nr:GntR family transcriptional regulator [Candidatus Dormibacteraeota bacterium]